MIRLINSKLQSGVHATVDLFADTKEEVTENAAVSGMESTTVMDAGSTVLTTDGHFALRNSSGEWVWQNEEDDDNISSSVSNSAPKAISRKAIDIEESDNSYNYDATPIEELSEKKDER